MKASTPIVLERENVNDETVTLVRWFAAHGDKVEVDALLAEVETSKANIEIHAPRTGYLVQEFAEGEEIPVTATIGYIAAEAPVSSPVRRPNPPAAGRMNGVAEPVSGFPAATEYRQRFSPVAARMMEAHGIPAAAFTGKSLVRRQDIEDYLNPPAPATPSRPEPRRFPLAKIAVPYREVKLSKRKRSENANLGAGAGNSLASSVSVTCFTRGWRQILEAKLGGNPSAVILFEVSRLLRKYPALNAVYRGGAMLEYENVNVGFAMDDGRGLKVAVLHDCDRRPLAEILEMLHELSIAYVEDKLTPAQIANPTFTISDLSGLGVSAFQPLIGDGQSAILGVSAEQFAPGSSAGFYTLTLTFDHQLSDGRTAALFLNDLKERLASYEKSAQEGRNDLVCSRCFRSAAELEAIHEHLLQLAGAEGCVCSICAAGW